MPRRASNRPLPSSFRVTSMNLPPTGRVPADDGRRSPGARREPLTTTDVDLLPRCRGGDQAAWRELVALHTRKVFGLAYRFTGRVDEAEDLTQEVFVKVYQTLGRYRESDGPFGGWLMAVARNHAIDHYRRRKQERLRRTEDPALLETAPAREEHPVAGLEREERRHLVHSGLRALPPDLRVPLILRDLQELPYEAIASELGIPLGTVKSRINRARLELAKRLLGRHRGLTGDTP
jgi:RNA polymerase sigma-70 factor (ECF subfamily)